MDELILKLKNLPTKTDKQNINQYFTSILYLITSNFPNVRKEELQSIIKKLKNEIIDSCIQFLLNQKKKEGKITIKMLDDIKLEMKQIENYFIGKTKDEKKKRDFIKLIEDRVHKIEPYEIYRKEIEKNPSYPEQVIKKMQNMGYQSQLIHKAKERYNKSFTGILKTIKNINKFTKKKSNKNELKNYSTENPILYNMNKKKYSNIYI